MFRIPIKNYYMPISFVAELFTEIVGNNQIAYFLHCYHPNQIINLFRRPKQEFAENSDQYITNTDSSFKKFYSSFFFFHISSKS